MNSFSLILVLAGMVTTQACGGFFCQQNLPVVQSGEAIAFGVTLGEESTTIEMHIQINYQGPSEEFSWLLPVPVQPDIDVGSEVMFQRLFQQTLPNYQFTINEEGAATCTAEELAGDDICRTFDNAGAVPEASPPEATILEEGSVGPFDFTILEATNNNPESIRTWLRANNYDEYEESPDLLNYYVFNNHTFVAVRLSKDADSGDIQPLVLTYEMPPVENIDEALIACVPIKLTAIAATPDMPIYAYIFGDHRAKPTNMFEVILDDTTVDWLGCQFSQSCYIADFQARFRQGVKDANNHAFYTEFAGDASIMSGQVEINIDTTELEQTTSTIEYFGLLTSANVPAIPIVHSIIAKYVEPQGDELQRGCTSSPSIFGQPQFCLDILAPETIEDPIALTAELKEKVFDPSISAQAFVDRYPYLTRLYAEMSPEHMTKDPFFSFDPDLPEVSIIRTAQGVPVCDDNQSGLAIEITVEDGSTVSVPAEKICGVWSRVGSVPLFGDFFSPVKAFTVHKFGMDEAVQIQRFNGTFVEEALISGVTRMDGRVVSQDVPEYVPLPPTVSPPSSPPVASPTSLSSSNCNFLGYIVTCWAAIMVFF